MLLTFIMIFIEKLKTRQYIIQKSENSTKKLHLATSTWLSPVQRFPKAFANKKKMKMKIISDSSFSFN